MVHAITDHFDTFEKAGIATEEYTQIIINNHPRSP
jgi:hypothetical protein